MTERTVTPGARWIDLAGERVALLPHKALWWDAARTLFVADVHLGKAATYRAHGVPVPESTTIEILSRLDALLASRPVQRVVWLGDFLHAREAQQQRVIGAIANWRAAHHAVAMTLVRGNHDARAGDPPPALGIDIVDEPLELGPFAACHHPQTLPGKVVLAGHLHPVVEVSGRAHQRLRLPCFWWQPGLMVLPAFGSFTGGALPSPRAGACAWPVGADQVWPAVACVPRRRGPWGPCA